MTSSPEPRRHTGGPILYGALADDDTGATDLAGRLADRGISTLMVVGLPPAAKLEIWRRGMQAVVIAIGSRHTPPAIASQRTRQAVSLLKALRPRQIHLKYCSSFDSTPAGNIGPMLDAALDELHLSQTILLPALPAQGRTTYQGYHFIRGELLSESPLRHHPLNPMIESNLVRHLSAQTRRNIGLLPYAVIEKGPASIRAELRRLEKVGMALILLDCLHQGHVTAIAEAVKEFKLTSGSSALAMELPRQGRKSPPIQFPPASKLVGNPHDGRGVLIAAGSCSSATLAQNRWFRQQGLLQIELDPRHLLQETLPWERIARQADGEISRQRPCLISTSSGSRKVQRLRNWASRHLEKPESLPEMIAEKFAGLIRQLARRTSPGGLVLAGGETSGKICRAMGWEAFRVGRNIDPGIPLCLTLEENALPVVLKSGNFGAEDFYGKALKAIRNLNRFFPP